MMSSGIDQPQWLTPVLQSVTFYNDCRISGHSRKVIYCITCMDGPICDQCSCLSHKGHETIRVFKASYGVSIRANHIRRYMDVSGIQPFLINSHQIFFLHSRGKSMLQNCSKCAICKGHVKGSQYKFCSIACKVGFGVEPINLDPVDQASEKPSIDRRPSNGNIKPSIGVEPANPDPVDQPSESIIIKPSIDQPSNATIIPSNGTKEGEVSTSRRTRSRKGIPHTSPLK